jgi:ribose 5-phosphate isomerase A
MTLSTQELRQAAAAKAVEYIQDGMTVGLGTGNTASYAITAVGQRVAQGLKIITVATSDRSEQMARDLGIPLANLDDIQQIDITIDGADEVDLATLHAIKGLGGALLREKLVACATLLETLIIDDSKVVQRLGERVPVPVEVIAFGYQHTQRALAALGCQPVLRKGPDGNPYLTDSRNYILDCKFPGIDDPETVAQQIKLVTGVVEHGLFLGVARRVIVARQDGIQVVEKGI